MDQGLFYRFETMHWPWLTAVLKVLTKLGNPEVMAVVVPLLVLAVVAAREWRAALCLAGAGLLGFILLEGAKRYVGRPRPDVAWRRLEQLPKSTSFPSGHALGSVAVYVTAALLLARRMRRRRTAYLLVAAAFVLALAIGFSRSYLGVHYPLDVLSGWLAGLCCALLACWADARWAWRPPPVAVDLSPEVGRIAPAGTEEGIERKGNVQLLR
jgi:membrane-associated phospholipid phosphatase